MGQTVYYLDSDNVCKSFTITCVNVLFYNDGRTSVYYAGEGLHSLPESELFGSLSSVEHHVFGEIMKPSDEEL